MSRTQRNILANFFGRGWSSLIFIVFTPVYIKLLGMEAYGLIGFFTTLQGVLFLLDLGLSTTLTREFGRLGQEPGEGARMRNVLRTLEVVYWGLAVVMTGLVWLAAPVISGHWLHARGFSSRELETAVMLMGLALAVQFPNNLYVGGLLGLQRQVLANIVAAVFVTVRFGGAALLLWLYRPSIEVFFAWHTVIALIQSLMTGALLWASLGRAAPRARFSWGLLRGVAGFAAGMTGLSLINTLYAQADKLLLSKFLSMEYYGYYMLAATVATGLYVFINPVYTAVFPLMAQYSQAHDERRLRDLYHAGCQLVSVVIVPIVAVIVLFSREILWVWTDSGAIVANAAVLLGIMVLGTLLNGLMNIPQALQLASGWTTLVLRLRLAALVLLVPTLYVLTRLYGAKGAALSLVLVESLYLVTGIVLMHGRLLKDDLTQWMLRDVLRPAATAVAIVVIGRFVIPADVTTVSGKLLSVSEIAVLTVIAMAAAGLQAPHIRDWMLQKSKYIFAR